VIFTSLVIFDPSHNVTIMVIVHDPGPTALTDLRPEVLTVETLLTVATEVLLLVNVMCVIDALLGDTEYLQLVLESADLPFTYNTVESALNVTLSMRCGCTLIVACA